jgi:hypothetical protein
VSAFSGYQDGRFAGLTEMSDQERYIREYLRRCKSLHHLKGNSARLSSSPHRSYNLQRTTGYILVKMHLSQLFAPFAIVGMVAAIPAKAPAAQKNQITGLPTKSVKCGAKHPREQTFTAAQIKTAAEQALDLVDDGKQLGMLLHDGISL